jgi:predicted transcriptional regulator
MTRARLNIFIEPDHATRLDQVAAHKGVSKSAVIAAALASFLSPDGEDQREAAIAKRLDQVAAHKGVSKSAVIAAALASFLSPDGEDQREAAIAKRLDRLSRQFDRLERDQNVLIETTALYVRYFLTVSLPVPEGQQDAARAQGRARYTQFIEQLARHIQRGRSLVREVHEDIEPAEAAQVGSGTESQEVHSESA